ncbi:SGNH hydrolase-type esterase domain-containing protein [Geopyxis carbonaria]|nr:SGNH hydrolase-type esterase domain-containing protein [Geopyxis carbonaria]
MVQITQLLALAVAATSTAFGAKILMAGDSTMAQSSTNIQGWGTPFANYMSLTVTNLARGGRSARSYTREGLWATLVSQISAGDYVIIEFGHNDGGSPASSDRASTFGDGTQTTTVTLSDGTVEVVQTFVTYEKRMIADVIAKGGIPVVSGQTPNGDAWNTALTLIAEPPRFVPYAEMAAGNYSQATYIDHWDWTGVRYEDMGYAAVYPTLFPNDHTHTSPAGADIVAQAFVNGLKCTGHPLANFLTAAGTAIPKVCSH